MATSFETWRRADEEWTDEDKDLIWRVLPMRWCS